MPPFSFVYILYDTLMTLTHSLADTQKLAEDFILDIAAPPEGGAAIVGLSGDLGSGKTAFVQSVAAALGVEQTVTSPTFVIEKIYKLKNQKFEHLIHIDAYRLESGDELLHLGWEEISHNSKNLILIEWPERVHDILPPHTQTTHFTCIDEITRDINFETYSRRPTS